MNYESSDADFESWEIETKVVISKSQVLLIISFSEYTYKCTFFVTSCCFDFLANIHWAQQETYWTLVR